MILWTVVCVSCAKIWSLWFDLLHPQIELSVQVMLGYAFHSSSIASIN